MDTSNEMNWPENPTDTTVEDGDVMVSFGVNCKNNNEELKKVLLSEIVEYIKNSPAGMVEMSRVLRSVLRYSKDRYRTMKTNLPFFSMSLFDPPYRGKNNFMCANGLILDIDLDTAVPAELIGKLKSDPRIAVGYVSPSRQGIKLIFVFDEPLKNSNTYAYVYKRFSATIALEYHLMDKLDQQNCDVSRISFLCNDPEAWYQKDYLPLIWKDYAEEEARQDTENNSDEKAANNLPDHTYKMIMERLGSKPKQIKAAIPINEHINRYLEQINKELQSYMITIKKAEPLPYGIKLHLESKKDEGEVNIYHGKKGFSVVVSARKNTNVHLSKAAQAIIEAVLTESSWQFL